MNLDRIIAAEARAVEEGHKAFRNDDGTYRVVSDTYVDDDGRPIPYTVTPIVPTYDDGFIKFVCDCPALNRSLVPCKHAALVARRLEREGDARWDTQRGWVSKGGPPLAVPGLANNPFADTFEDPFGDDDPFDNVFTR